MRSCMYSMNSQTGRVVSIDDIDKENKEEYICIGCGHSMIPVLGEVRDHHFRHKANIECCKETYLHKLYKELFKQKFEASDSFEVEYYVYEKCNRQFYTKLCHGCSNKGGGICSHGMILYKEDLKHKYDTCEVEVEYKGFRADLLLTNSKDDSVTPLFVEIMVSHECEERKINSGVRIIEIDCNGEVNDELELKELVEPCGKNTYPVNEIPKVRFYNFDREARCNRKFERFYIEKGNEVDKLQIECETLSCDEISRKSFDTSLFYVLAPSDVVRRYNDERFYSFCLSLLVNLNVIPRHCFVCYRHSMCVANIDGEKYRVSQHDNRSTLIKWQLAKCCNRFMCPKRSNVPRDILESCCVFNSLKKGVVITI